MDRLEKAPNIYICVRKTGAATPAPGNFNAVLSPIHCGLKGAILDLEKNKWMGNFLFIL